MSDERVTDRPKETDNGPREEDGPQDLSQDPGVAYVSEVDDADDGDTTSE